MLRPGTEHHALRSTKGVHSVAMLQNLHSAQLTACQSYISPLPHGRDEIKSLEQDCDMARKEKALLYDSAIADKVPGSQ